MKAYNAVATTAFARFPSSQSIGVSWIVHHSVCKPVDIRNVPAAIGYSVGRGPRMRPASRHHEGETALLMVCELQQEPAGAVVIQQQ